MFAKKNKSKKQQQQQDALKQQRRAQLEQQEHETVLKATLAQEEAEEQAQQQQQQQQQQTTEQQQQEPSKEEQELRAREKRVKQLEKYYLSTIPQEIDDSDDDDDDHKMNGSKRKNNLKKNNKNDDSDSEEVEDSDDDDDDDDEMNNDGFSFFQEEDDDDDRLNFYKKRRMMMNDGVESDEDDDESGSDIDSDDDDNDGDENGGKSLSIKENVLKNIIENEANSDDEDDEDGDDDDENDEAMSDDEEGGDDNDDDEHASDIDEEDGKGDDDENEEDQESSEAASETVAEEEGNDDDDENAQLPDDQLKDFDMKGNTKRRKAEKKKKSSDGAAEDSDEENELEKTEYDKTFFAADDEDDGADAPETTKNITFNEMSLSRPLKKAIDSMGFVHPTPIQAKTIPVLLKGNDICASAVTGSGKTAAFLLPTLEKLLYRNRNEKAIRALVLLPTRELAQQCFDVAAKLAKFTDITMCLVVGGDVNQKQQTDALRRCPDLVIATPGRIVDHLLNTANFGLESLEILVLDEADRLLELGFQPQLEEVINSIPKARQTMLFSATMTDSVSELIKLSLKNPRRIAIDNRADVSSTLEQEFVRIRGRNEVWREGVLMSLVTRTFTEQVIIFVNRKDTARRLVILFKVKKLKVSELHGNLTQAQRLSELKKFTVGKTNYMICTDVAARGLDIKNVKTVINFEMPTELKTYIHRVGRTARAGQAGTSVSLTGEEDRLILKQIVKRAKANGESIKHRVIPNETILYWTQKIEAMAKQIKEIETSDQVERELERAEMKAAKVKNLVEFAGEIASRPKKEWVMSKEAEKKLNKREREEKGVDAKTGKRVKREEGDVSQAKPEKKDRKNMTKRELKREAEKRLEQQALQAHGIKNLTKFMKGAKAKVRVTDKLANKGIKVPEIVEAKKKQEAKKNERRELKKDARRAKREAKLKGKSAEKREAEKIERELYKSTKPKKSAKTKQRYKRRK